MSLSLYGYWRSSATYRVRIALNLKQLTYQYIPVHLVNNGGEQNAQDYVRLNPNSLYRHWSMMMKILYSISR